MAINKKLIKYATKARFATDLGNSLIPNTSVVFIQDTGELWTHGTFFGGKFSSVNSNYGTLTIGGDSVNLSLYGHKHSYTDLTGTTTIANQALVSSGTTDGWVLKTLGSNAFDSTAYLPLTGGNLTGVLELSGGTSGWPTSWGTNNPNAGLKITTGDEPEVIIMGVNKYSGGWIQVAKTTNYADYGILSLNTCGGPVIVGYQRPPNYSYSFSVNGSGYFNSGVVTPYIDIDHNQSHGIQDSTSTLIIQGNTPHGVVTCTGDGAQFGIGGSDGTDKLFVAGTSRFTELLTNYAGIHCETTIDTLHLVTSDIKSSNNVFSLDAGGNLTLNNNITQTGGSIYTYNGIFFYKTTATDWGHISVSDINLPDAVAILDAVEANRLTSKSYITITRSNPESGCALHFYNSSNTNTNISRWFIDNEGSTNGYGLGIYRYDGTNAILSAKFGIDGIFHNYGAAIFSGNVTAPIFIGALTGNATTASALINSYTINGTNFNGTENITTNSWGTARNITIGNTTKSVNGSTAYSWSISEIGLDKYLPLSGGIMTGQIIGRATGSSWVSDRDNTCFYNPRSGSGGYFPTLGMKTVLGSWSIGTYNTEDIFFNYVSDEYYNAGHNNDAHIAQLNSFGVILTSNNYTSYSPNINGSRATNSTSIYAPTSQLSVQNGTNTYLIGSPSTTSLSTVYSNPSVYINGASLYASNFIGNITGNLTGTASQATTSFNSGIAWTANVTVGSWSSICVLPNTNTCGSYILTLSFTDNNEASCNTYLISTGWTRAKIIQIGFNNYSGNSSQQIRLTQNGSSSISCFVEVLEPYGSNGATTRSVPCRINRVDNGSVTAASVYTANTSTAGGTVWSSLVSSSNKIVADLGGTADTATLASTISANSSTTTQAYLLGVTASGTTPIYDPGIYITSTSGTLHATAMTASTFTGNLSGTASYATKLSTARNIWGQSFNGSSDIIGSFSLNNGALYISDESTYRKIQTYDSKPLSLNPEGNFVGIGVTIPSYCLDVVGQTRSSGFIMTSHSSDDYVLLSNGTAISQSSLAIGTTTVSWSDIVGRPSAVSYFTNDSGYVTSSGSVAYATSAGNAATLSNFTVSDRESPIDANNTVNNGLYYYASNGPTQETNTDGGLYVQAHNNAWQGQIAQNYRTGALSIRGKNNNVWTSWNSVLDSSNFNSYALPITGGNLTGNLTLNNNTISIKGAILNSNGTYLMAKDYNQSTESPVATYNYTNDLNESTITTLKDYIDKLLPVGTILQSGYLDDNIFGSKWLECNGSVVSKEDYPKLSVTPYLSSGAWKSSSNYITPYVVYGGGKFVKYENVSDKKEIYYSSDAVTWTAAIAPSYMNHMVYGNGKFVASYYDGSKIYYSSDAVTWTTETFSVGISDGIIYGGEKFVAWSYNSETIYYSSDAVTWTTATLPGTVSGIIYGGEKFVAWSYDSGTIYYSSDAVTWTTETFSGGISGGIIYGGEKFVAWSYNRETIYYSSDAVTWTTATLPGTVSGIIYGGGKFVAWYRGTIYYSSDAVTWTTETLPDTVSGIIYGGEKFVVWSFNSETIYYSSDAVTWTTATLPDTVSGIIYGGEKFVARSLNSETIYYSSDAVTWTTATLPGTVSGIIYGGEKFVAWSYDSETIYYSSDAVTWTTATLPGTVSGIIYGGGKFVAGLYNRGDTDNTYIFVSLNLERWVKLEVGMIPATIYTVDHLDNKIFMQKYDTTEYYYAYINLQQLPTIENSFIKALE